MHNAYVGAPSRAGEDAKQALDAAFGDVYPCVKRLTSNVPARLWLADIRADLPANFDTPNFVDAEFRDADQRSRFEADLDQIALMNGWKDAVLVGPVVAAAENVEPAATSAPVVPVEPVVEEVQQGASDDEGDAAGGDQSEQSEQKNESTDAPAAPVVAAKRGKAKGG